MAAGVKYGGSVKRLVFIIMGTAALFGLGWRYARLVDKPVTVIITPSPATVSSSSRPLTDTSASDQGSLTPRPTLAASLRPNDTPATINLDVAFTSQAPTGIWDEFHEETCEEAAILTAAWFAESKRGEAGAGYTNRLPPSEAENKLVAAVAWEKQNLPDWRDTTVAQTVRLAKDFFDLKNISLLVTPTAETIKQQLANGKIVVAPTAGRLLKNPHFKQPGPIYHMLVIRGYRAGEFIVNDPGTRVGEGYVYQQSVVLNAIHDWNGSADTLETGSKTVIVIDRQ